MPLTASPGAAGDADSELSPGGHLLRLSTVVVNLSAGNRD
jgi:hypothetical protein